MLHFNVIKIRHGVGVPIDMDQWLKEHVYEEHCPHVVSQITTHNFFVSPMLVYQNIALAIAICILNDDFYFNFGI